MQRDFFSNIAHMLARVLGLSRPSTQSNSPVAATADDDLNFLMEVLQATEESEGNQQVVYPLLQANLDKLDNHLINMLQSWANDILSEVEPDQAQRIAKKIWNFSWLIQEFPLGSKAVNQDIAIAGYEITLTIYTRQDFPIDWAMTQNNLGIAYSDRILGNKATNLEGAIAAYNAALQVSTRQDFPQSWATTQNNLGLAYSDRILGDKATNLEGAIASCNAALEVRTRQDFPLDWAGTQNNLGLAYSDRIVGNKAENIELAIAAYNAALEVSTRQDFPLNWAMTQNNLGNAYLYRILGNRASNLEGAIAAYNAALAVYTRQDFPLDWAQTQNCLGNAYLYRILGNRASDLEGAIAAYNAALEVLTRQDFPLDWAQTQNNLGNAYLYRILGNKAENLETAIIAYNAALEVRTRQDFPIDWAMTQNNLGLAYRDLGQISEAIQCLRSALEIRTPTAFPIDCLQSGRNLGETAFQAERWSDAIEGYDAAIQAVEQSCEWVSSEARRQELREDAIDVYTQIVQACVNNNQIEKAIEYVERSKARTLVELLTNRDLNPKGNVPDDVLKQLQRLKREIPAKRQLLEAADRHNAGNTQNQFSSSASSLNPLRQELSELQSQLEEVLNQIKPIDPSYQLTQTVQPISFAEILDTIDNHTAIIAWYITSECFFTFVITHQKPLYVWQSTNDDLTALEQWRNEYLKDYEALKREQKTQWQTDLASRLQHLSTILHLDDIRSHVPSECKRLILIPHRYLHLFPLHALPLHSQGNYLFDSFPKGVHYAPSCQLLQLSQKVASRQAPSFRHLFAIQNPTADLDFSDVEVEAIMGKFHPKQILSKDKANKNALNQAADSDALRLAECVHFSCHGSFFAPDPLLSHLMLADSLVASDSLVKRTASEATRYLPWRDGKDVDPENCLTLGEIFALNLKQCRLVTLSACETGLTEWRNLTDEYIGLASGFLVAGSPNIVSSLWVVNDLSTCFLMIKFYQNLQPEVSIAKALNNAQNWLRDVTKAELQKWTQELTLSANQQLTVDSLWFNDWLKEMEATSKPFHSPEYWAGFCTVGQ